MLQIIDRRLNGRNKSALNRQRFIRRYKEQIKKAAEEAISRRSVTDTSSGENVSIPTRDISEPVFQKGRGGKQQRVLPGNTDFIKGDEVDRPESGGGSGRGDASKDGEGKDNFTFELSRDEFLKILFEDLELPYLNKTQVQTIIETETVRAGISRYGVPSNIYILKSLQSALGRRLALRGQHRTRLKQVESELLELQDEKDSELIALLQEEQRLLRKRISAIPFIDTFDLRYHNRVERPKPKTQAVMFCLMDVSGSMDKKRKDIAKRFFALLYHFLNHNYEHTQVVFIRHHISAKEVDEDEFFNSLESGGTIVSSALKMMDNIIKERYPVSEWNIYGAQASDGDNWHEDSGQCRQLMEENILPKSQYYAYVQIDSEKEQELWKEYETVRETCSHFGMQKIMEHADIYPVFRQLLKKREA